MRGYSKVPFTIHSNHYPDHIAPGHGAPGIGKVIMISLFFPSREDLQRRAFPLV